MLIAVGKLCIGKNNNTKYLSLFSSITSQSNILIPYLMIYKLLINWVRMGTNRFSYLHHKNKNYMRYFRIGTVQSFKDLCEHHFSAIKDILIDRTVVFGGTESGLSLGK